MTWNTIGHIYLYLLYSRSQASKKNNDLILRESSHIRSRQAQHPKILLLFLLALSNVFANGDVIVKSNNSIARVTHPSKRFSSPRARIALDTSLPTFPNCSARESANHFPAARVVCGLFIFSINCLMISLILPNDGIIHIP